MTTKLNFKQIFIAGVMASIASLVINAILFFVFHSTGVISDSVFVQPNQPLTITPVLMASIVPTLIAACVFFLFERFTNNGFKIFSIVAIVLLLLSIASPFMAIQGIALGYSIVLSIMHIVVVLSLLYSLKKAKN